MSDLHLEVGQQYDAFGIPAVAPNLVLAGDIGRLKDYEKFRTLLSRHCQIFEHVFLVLGNHEFFGVSREEGLELACELEMGLDMKERLTIMNRRRVDLNGLILLGCILQSYIPPDKAALATSKINDFRHIKDWTVGDHVKEHERDDQRLKDELLEIASYAEEKDGKVLVMTHTHP